MKPRAWNSSLPAPTKPMKRTRLGPGSGVARPTPMTRSGKLKVRRVSKRFAKRRNPEYRAFIRTFECLVLWRDQKRKCTGLVECAHVVSRGAGGYDVGDTIPLCRGHHLLQHQIGIQSFQKLYGIDLAAQAARLASMWKLARGYESA